MGTRFDNSHSIRHFEGVDGDETVLKKPALHLHMKARRVHAHCVKLIRKEQFQHLQKCVKRRIDDRN